MWLSKFFGADVKESGRFLCHIGPPKTGTTAIQAALQKANSKQICYLGTFQPRTLNQKNGIYAELMNYVLCDGDINSLLKTHKKINRILHSGSSIFLSDEMFLVNQGSTDFEEKLSRLKNAVGCFPCTIIISLREPISAIKSLYLEIYYRQAILPKVSFDQFLLSNQVRVYDYIYLLAVLKKNGFCDVKWITIQKGQTMIDLASITGSPAHGQILPLEDKNQTESTFLKKVDLLEFPEDFIAYYRSGYQQASQLIQNS